MSKIDLRKATSNDIIEIGKQVSDHFDIVNHIGDKDKLKSIFSNFREMGGSVSNDSWAKGSSKAVKDGIEEAFSYYPEEWSKIPEKHNKKILENPDVAFLLRGRLIQKELRMTKNTLTIKMDI